MSAIESRVLWRGTPTYEDARTAVWNLRKETRYPAAILRAESAEDVASALALARSRGLRVAVRSGGHSWWGSGVREDTFMIELSRLNSISIDAKAQTATVGPAVQGRVFADALAKHGLFFPVGHCSTVALGGFLLAGGLGWGFGSLGPSCFHVLAFDAVLADGRIIHVDTASPGEHADLVWAQRGAGPGFPAIITSFTLRVVPLPCMYETTMIFPLSELREFCAWSDAMVKSGSVSPKVELTVFATPAPAPAPLPPRVLMLSASVFGTSDEECAAALAPFATYPNAQRALVHVPPARTDLAKLLDGSDQGFQLGRYVSDVCFTDVEPADLYAALEPLVTSPPDVRALVFMIPTPPMPPGAAPPNGAISMMGRTVVGVYGISMDPARDAANAAWVSKVGEAIRAHGFYTGECNMVAGAERARRCFAPPVWERLQGVIARYDPSALLAGFPRASELQGEARL